MVFLKPCTNTASMRVNCIDSVNSVVQNELSLHTSSILFKKRNTLFIQNDEVFLSKIYITGLKS